MKDLWQTRIIATFHVIWIRSAVKCARVIFIITHIDWNIIAIFFNIHVNQFNLRICSKIRHVLCLILTKMMENVKGWTMNQRFQLTGPSEIDFVSPDTSRFGEIYIQLLLKIAFTSSVDYGEANARHVYSVLPKTWKNNTRRSCGQTQLCSCFFEEK